MKGSSRALSRFACAVALAGAGVLLPPLHGAALNSATLACPHLHATYSYTAPGFFGMSNGVRVTASTCSDGRTGTGTSGTGTVTLQQADSPLTGTAWREQWDLFLDVAGVSEHVAFDAVVVPYSLLVAPSPSPGTFDYGATGPIRFSAGTGSGVLTERCTYSPWTSLVTCSDDAVFAVQGG